MQSNNRYIVYMHRLKIDGRVYIGQTKDALQRRSGYDGSRYKNCSKFYNAIQFYGWDNFEHIVLYENLTLKEANFKEAELIKKYDSINNGFNLVEGGRNHEWSMEYREAMRERTLGDKNPNYGKPRSEETKRKIGAANKISQLGKHHSAETKEKISNAHKKYIPILCIETNKKYNCPTDAALDVANTRRAGHITEVCKGERKTAFGYHWVYLNDEKEIDNE